MLSPGQVYIFAVFSVHDSASFSNTPKYPSAARFSSNNRRRSRIANFHSFITLYTRRRPKAKSRIQDATIAVTLTQSAAQYVFDPQFKFHIGIKDHYNYLPSLSIIIDPGLPASFSSALSTPSFERSVAMACACQRRITKTTWQNYTASPKH
ncbi:hypothetical protein BKA56DRAFT_673064 [Ilyonectria sp. MPI-CAGE-AT-0026]|nr:hypothetical protein BKA56DRAFT_673064 [Ilyonectria sp. MPI-CAGE-AT-0026]